MFIISGFGDEISPDLDLQLEALKGMSIDFLELRGAWGKSVLDFSDQELERVKQALRERGMSVSSLASPIGKVPIDGPWQPHFEDFLRILQMAEYLETGYVRVFSFYIPEGRHADYRSEVLRRLEAMTGAVEGRPLTLLHENESHIYGDIPERAADILRTIDSPKLRAVYDPSNYIQVGVERPFDQAWPLLGEYVQYVHVKDAKADSKVVVPAGEGDGQVRELLQALKARGDDHFLSLEPHLVFTGTYTGFTGEELFRQALSALQRLLETLG